MLKDWNRSKCSLCYMLFFFSDNMAEGFSRTDEKNKVYSCTQIVLVREDSTNYVANQPETDNDVSVLYERVSGPELFPVNTDKRSDMCNLECLQLEKHTFDEKQGFLNKETQQNDGTQIKSVFNPAELTPDRHAQMLNSFKKENNVSNTMETDNTSNKVKETRIPIDGDNDVANQTYQENTNDVTILYDRVKDTGFATNITEKLTRTKCCLSYGDHTESNHHSCGKRLKMQNEILERKHLLTFSNNHESANDKQSMTIHESGCAVIKTNRIKIEDTFGRFIETKVKCLQEDTKSDKARNIQETIAENLKYFLKEVEKIEPIFSVSELIQVGSYAEGTKINKPDEFDFLAVVDHLSNDGPVVLEHDESLRAGCVSLSLDNPNEDPELLKLCENGVLQCFQSKSMSKSFFGPKQFGKVFVKAVMNIFKQKVFQFQSSGCMTMATPIDIDFGGGGLIVSKKGISLVLRKVEFKTPNILLQYVSTKGLEISVDLSPAIRYNRIEECIFQDKCSCPALYESVKKQGSVLLVGNSSGGFRITVTECEVKLMQNVIQYRHKLLYIFLKYLCSIYSSDPLKAFTSYMLKQLCIYHDLKCVSDNESMLSCFGNVIDDMQFYCDEGKLPSVLNSDVDLFSSNIHTIVDGHFRLHFLLALRVIHKQAREKVTFDSFEVFMKDVLDKWSDMWSHYCNYYNSSGSAPESPIDVLTLQELDINCPVCNERRVITDI